MAMNIVKELRFTNVLIVEHNSRFLNKKNFLKFYAFLRHFL